MRVLYRINTPDHFVIGGHWFSALIPVDKLRCAIRAAVVRFGRCETVPQSSTRPGRSYVRRKMSMYFSEHQQQQHDYIKSVEGWIELCA